jgi:predicted transcriptional regulator
MQTKEREYWADRDCTVPVVDEDSRYRITNKKFSLTQIQTRDPIRNQLVPMNMKAREKVVLMGSQITNYIWELEKRGFIKVEMLPAEDGE